MKRYRIGKDVANRLRVRTNGEYTPLAGRDISLQMTDPKGCKTWEYFTIVDDYKMLFVFYGKDQKYTGTYQLTVWENYGKTGQTVVDCIGAFRLVANTTLEGGEDPEGLDTEVNDLELDISTAEGGAEGVGVASIEQTTTSTEDGGINEITSTLTNGVTSIFEIRNGQRGSQGVQGEKGEKGDAGEDWIPTQQELASIASSAAALVDVPTKTSDLQNDSGFVTSNSPSFTGTPTAPTPISSAAAESYQIANVEFIIGEISEKVTNKIGQQNGIASLDSNGKVPSSQLPSSGGGDTNVIEVVKVNGTALTPDSNKAVDVPVPTKVSDLQNDSGYITGYTETDPVFTASAAHGISSSDISSWNAKGTYSKPSGGIPATDLASAVQTSLGKADTALQSFTETDPTVPNWAKQSTKPTYTASEVGALPASTTIPSALADLSADSTHRVVTDAEKATWNAKGTYSKPSGGIPASDIASGVIPTVPTTVSSFSNDANYVASTAITIIVSLTQAQYDALATKDSNTLYIIPEE